MFGAKPASSRRVLFSEKHCRWKMRIDTAAADLRTGSNCARKDLRQHTASTTDLQAEPDPAEKYLRG
jgi:hypothetical protein